MSTVSKRTVTTTRQEYAVPSPAAAADLQKAINWAMSDMPPERRVYDDSFIAEARDDEIVIWWAGQGRAVMTDLPTLTVRQPWASLIAAGVKTIETRSWSTKHRGHIAIHAGASKPQLADLHAWIGPHCLGLWAAEIVHADPCECDEEEYHGAGGRCFELNEWQHALLNDEGAHGFSLAMTLPLGAIVATAELIDVVPMVHTTQPRNGNCLVVAGQRGLMLHGDPTEPGRDVSEQLPYGDFAPGRFALLLDDIKPSTERCPACWGQDGEICFYCMGERRRPPILARGRQRLWRWAP